MRVKCTPGDDRRISWGGEEWDGSVKELESESWNNEEGDVGTEVYRNTTNEV